MCWNCSASGDEEEWREGHDEDAFKVDRHDLAVNEIKRWGWLRCVRSAR